MSDQLESAQNSDKRELINLEFVWCVKKISRVFEKQRPCVEGNSELSSEESQIKNLVIKPRLIVADCDNFISIYLKWVDQRLELLKASVDIEVTMSNSDHLVFGKQTVFLTSLGLPGEAIGWKKFIKKNLVSRNSTIPLKDDCVFMRLNMKIELVEVKSLFNSVLELSTDLELLVKNNIHSDITFRIGDKMLKAHKSILSARSSVFSAMFQHDMVENTTNSIDITDFNFDTMKKLLYYIYSGKVNDSSNLKALMTAAEKYNLQTLKSMCASTLESKIDKDNCCEILLDAELLSCAKLRKAAMNFMLENMDEVVSSNGFNELICPNPELMKEITLALFQSSSKNKKLKRSHED